MFRTFLVFTMLMVLSSCGPKIVFEEKHIFEDNAWSYDDIIHYEFDIQDTVTTYDMVLELEHSSDYVNQNIYTNISTIFPSGEETSNVLSIDMSDNLGQWYGKCSGEKCRLNVVLRENIRFRENGKYNLKFEQYTRMESVKGLFSAALIIRESAK